MTVSQLAQLSNLSKGYISQVKNGKRPSSDGLLQSLRQYHSTTDKGRKKANAERMIERFIESRSEGTSQGTIDFYRKYLTKSIPVLGLTPKAHALNAYLDGLTCSIGGKHAYFRAISVFFNWIYSPRSGLKFGNKSNPIALIEPLKRPKLILPSLTRDQVQLLISEANSTRDKAIISLFAESEMRLSELVSMKVSDIDWDVHTIRIMGKGNKERYAPFGFLAEGYLKTWLDEYEPKPTDAVWNVGSWGVKAMLTDLGLKTGLACKPHTFRRTFACLLRKAGIDTMTIKDLGRWESLEMVQRYTRSVTFHDSLKHYKAPLSQDC